MCVKYKQGSKAWGRTISLRRWRSGMPQVRSSSNFAQLLPIQSSNKNWQKNKGGTIRLSGECAVESYAVTPSPSLHEESDGLDVKYHGLIGTNETTLVSPYPISVFLCKFFDQVKESFL